MNAVTEVKDVTDLKDVQDMQTPSERSPLAWASAAVALMVLAGCGGGDESPERLFQNQAAIDRPDLLPREAGTGTRIGQREQGQATRTPMPTELFDWAELRFPQFFPSRERDQTAAGGLTYRYYPSTSTYLAVSGDAVLLLGPATNNKPANVGSLSSFADAVLAPSAVLTPASDEDAARFLLHAQFSASESEIAAVRAKGYAGWLDQQLALPNGQSGWDWLVGKGYSVIDTNEYFFANGVFRHMVWYEMFKSSDAVRKRWALALSEIFVVGWRGIKDVMNWDSFGMAAYWDLLCTHGLGTYRNLLEELTLNPAMGAFLSTRGNEREDPTTGRQPDENYAREVMQLFSIGLYELNLDGSLRLDANGKPIETYTSDDVSQLARVFTGYNQDYSRPKFNSPKPPHLSVNHIESARGRMVFDSNKHSILEKKFLGVTIPPNTSGSASLQMALDALTNHPNNGPFLARQFIQRLVTSNPSPAYVARVASVFNNNGSGVRGDLKAVLRAVLLDDEARGSASLQSNTFGKLREPMLRVAQWARTFKANSLKGTWKLQIAPWSPTQDIGQYPLDPPSVFNFFRPGYVPPGTPMAREGATVPEFQIVNESTVSSWANYLLSIVPQGIWVRAPEIPSFPSDPTPTDGPDIVPDYSAELALVLNPEALVNRLNLLLCAGQLRTETVQLIVNGLKADQLGPQANDQFRRTHVARAILFVMCSADYLVQR